MAPIPDPQGPGCDAFKTALPNWKGFATQPVGTVLASIPDISTFNSLVSGQANPAVNIVPSARQRPVRGVRADQRGVRRDGARPARRHQGRSRGADKLDYYHVFLGLLGPDDVKGQRPTQQGAEIKVTGKGGDIKVNDTAKVVCGGIQASNARIYIIDTVLDPAQGPEPITPTRHQLHDHDDDHHVHFGRGTAAPAIGGRAHARFRWLEA